MYIYLILFNFCQIEYCQISFSVSVNTLKQKVTVAIDKTKSIKEDTSETKVQVHGLDQKMDVCIECVTKLSNFVKVLYIYWPNIILKKNYSKKHFSIPDANSKHIRLFPHTKWRSTGEVFAERPGLRRKEGAAVHDFVQCYYSEKKELWQSRDRRHFWSRVHQDSQMANRGVIF